MAVKIDLAKKKIALGVGDIVAEPLARVGRAAGIGVWTRFALGREAHLNHQRAQAELREGYQREIAVRYRTTVDEFAVTVQGRIDGVYQPRAGGNGHSGQWVIEEIKSVVLPPLEFAALEAHAYPHYVEQLRLYCFFVAQEQKGAVAGRLVFVNVAGGARKDIDLRGPFDDCEKLLSDRVRALIGQAREEKQRLERRRAVATGLSFPHEKPRKFQDEMIAAVQRALAAGRHLMISAPSGIGKTTGALYPVVRFALSHDKRVFFVTAKNTQQQIAWDTLRRMGGESGAHPTAVQFRAREQMCINDVYACREEFCPHLRDFQAKVESTRVVERLLGQRLVAPEAMMDAGRQARVCPFELALLESELTDVIVCDYNYVFDPQVYFRRFFMDADYSSAILVIDEAHNLLQRAMDYYSPSLRLQQIKNLGSQLKHLEVSLQRDVKKFLARLEEFFRNLSNRDDDPFSQIEEDQRGTVFVIDPPRAAFEEFRSEFNRLTVRYMLDKLTSGRALPDDPVQEFFSDFGQFCNVLAMEGEEFSHVFDTTNGQSLKIVCKDPSKLLAQRIEGFHSVVAMSATLTPMEFYRQMLGFDPARTDAIALPSPFPRENRKILVVPSVSTTFQRRAANFGRIAEIISQTVRVQRGNYMALFPSYEFLRAVAEKLGERVGAELVVQEPKMKDSERQRLLDALQTTEPPKLVLAVQGGLFAEGVDYPGELLSGVIVISPALPQVSFERELMRRYYEERYGKGFEFAYLYPGMNRVIQSVGRLIRTETDRGVAVLVCQRFAQAQYSALFPPDWSDGLDTGFVCKDLELELRLFWDRRA